jgi:hypothetical protein
LCVSDIIMNLVAIVSAILENGCCGRDIRREELAAQN